MNALRYVRQLLHVVVTPRSSTPLRQQQRPSSSSSSSFLLFKSYHLYTNYHQFQQQSQQLLLLGGGVRYMSKYLSKSRKKNIPLTTKRAHKGFYKGKGGTSEGRLNSTGRFIVHPWKRLTLVVPSDLQNCKLKPYIASSASRFPPEQRHNAIPT